MTLPLQLPAVSIILPVRNEVATIGAALDACLLQDYEGSLETVVADAMSTDGTRSVVDGYSSSSAVTMVDNEALTTPAGLNAAIKAATGEVIVRCDAHSEFPQGYVDTAVRLLAEMRAVNVGGVQRAVGSATVQRAIAAAMSSSFGVGDARFHRGGKPGFVDTVYLGVFSRDALTEVGGFDEALIRNQDYELNYRLRDQGGFVYFDPSLEVVYRPRPSLAGLWRQYFEYGQWKRVVIKRHPGSARWRQLVAPTFVIGLLLSLIALVAGFPLLAALVPGSYFVANLFASAVDLFRRRDWAMLTLPAAFATMHLAWGTGFLWPSNQD